MKKYEFDVGTFGNVKSTKEVIKYVQKLSDFILKNVGSSPVIFIKPYRELKSEHILLGIDGGHGSFAIIFSIGLPMDFPEPTSTGTCISVSDHTDALHIIREIYKTMKESTPINIIS